MQEQPNLLEENKRHKPQRFDYFLLVCYAMCLVWNIVMIIQWSGLRANVFYQIIHVVFLGLCIFYLVDRVKKMFFKN